MKQYLAGLLLINCSFVLAEDLDPNAVAKYLQQSAGSAKNADELSNQMQKNKHVQKLVSEGAAEDDHNISPNFAGKAPQSFNDLTIKSDKDFQNFSVERDIELTEQGYVAKIQAIKDSKDQNSENLMGDAYKNFLVGTKFDVQPNDEQLNPALWAQDPDVMAKFSNQQDDVDGASSVVSKITTHICYESVHKEHRTCISNLHVPVTIRPEEDRLVTLYAATNTYDGHGVNANLRTGVVSVNKGNIHSGTRIENPLTNIPSDTQITLLGKTINSSLWTDAGVHSFEVYRFSGSEPSVANNFTYSYSVEQGAMGSRSARRRNRNNMRGYVDQWKFHLKFMPKISGPDVWHGCESYQALANRRQCSLVQEECVDATPRKVINSLSVARNCWQKKYTYRCKMRDDQSDCDKYKREDCKQIDSTCAEEVAGVCVLYKQTYECGRTKDSTIAQGFANIVNVASEPLQYTPNNDFGSAMAGLQLAGMFSQEMQGSDYSTIFRGKEQSCRIRPQQCCPQKGIWKKLLGCSSEEDQLHILTNKGLCVYVAEGKTKEKLTDKVFHGRLQKHCCFESKLARIIQVGVRSQLGIDWGTFECPHCRALTFHELEDPRIDWDKIDFSELTGELKEKFDNLSRPDLINALKCRLQSSINPHATTSSLNDNMHKKISEHNKKQEDTAREVSEFLGEVQR